MPIPTLYSKDSVDNLLADKLDLAGGTMTGGLTLSATGIIFSDATTLTTAPAGATLAADQLTAGVVATNPAAGPTASGDVLQYDGTDLIWAAGGGGGGLTISDLSNGATSTLNATAPTTGQALTYDGTDLVWSTVGGVAWGDITGTLSSQTDLQTELDGKLGPKSVYTLTGSYTLAAGDANNIVYCPTGAGGGFNLSLTIPDDATYSFPVGTIITLCVDNSASGTQIDFVQGNPGTPAPTLVGPIVGAGISNTTSGHFYITKIAADRWLLS